jgi:uncharacterized protein (TIGR02145 family)
LVEFRLNIFKLNNPENMKKVMSLLLGLTVYFFITCKKEEPTLPVLATTAVTDITATTATSGGIVVSDGGAAITARGICWGIAANPTTAGTKTTDSDGTGQFVSNITGIDAGTLYHVRAYATNSVGTAYGADLSFSSLGQVPSATTLAATDITATGSTLNGTVNANYSSTTVTFEYGLTTDYGSIAPAIPSPVTGNTGTNVSAELTDLTSVTTYHFRIKAVNSLGTEYGTDMSFTTLLADIDGNVYTTVTIGTQVWMKENLNTTKYNDGTAVPNITDNTAWSTLITGAYSDYNNTPSNSTTYGRLYNWYAVDNNELTKLASNGGKNVCPTGWHVPSYAEWTTLISYLGGDNVAGGKLKETGTAHWNIDSEATNETGFTALPGGLHDTPGQFLDIGDIGYWWSSTDINEWDAKMWGLYYYDQDIVHWYMVFKMDGCSVRCLRDF